MRSGGLPVSRASIATILFPLLGAAVGVFAILQGLFAFLPTTGPPRPGDRFLTLLIGAVFLCGGIGATLTALGGRVARALASGMALVVAVGLTLLLGWVAFGPGHHAISSPFVVFGPRVAEATGRVAFALGALVGGGARHDNSENLVEKPHPPPVSPAWQLAQIASLFSEAT